MFVGLSKLSTIWNTVVAEGTNARLENMDFYADSIREVNMSVITRCCCILRKLHQTFAQGYRLE